MRAVDQHRRGWTEWSQRRFRSVHELPEPPFGARYAEHTYESGFSGSEVLAGRFAHQGRIALDVEEIVGNLKRFADRCAKTCKRFALLCAGAAENAAGLAGEAQQRAGLHRLQHPYFALAVTDCADRKSTRLNSSHRCISYAVFCLKKKKKDGHGDSMI